MRHGRFSGHVLPREGSASVSPSGRLPIVRRRLLPLFAALSLACAAVLVIWVQQRVPEYDGKPLLLKWADYETGRVFRVTEKPRAIFGFFTHLHVEQGARRRARMIDEDAAFETVLLIRYEHWLLVADQRSREVRAGYDYDADTLYGDHEWDRLPFTRWAGQGKVVARRDVRWAGSGTSPAGFPRG